MKKGNGKTTEAPEPAIVRGSKMKREIAEAKVGRIRKACETAAASMAERRRAVETQRRAVEKVRTEFETLGAKLLRLPLDDPTSEARGGRHRHLELVLNDLTAKLGGAEGQLAAEEQQAKPLREALATAEAEARNADRTVRLTEIQVEFPQVLAPVLDLFAQRREVLAEADLESHRAEVPTVGRARLFVTRQQMGADRGHNIDELIDALERHGAVLAVAPTTPASGLDMPEAGNGDEDPVLAALIAEAAAEELAMAAETATPTSTLRPGERYFTPKEGD